MNTDALFSSIKLPFLMGVMLYIIGHGVGHAQDSGITETKVEVSAITEDQKISQRLSNVYKAVGGMDKVVVRTASGVVILEGTVTDSETAETAVALAQKTEGVIFVSNRIETASDISGRLQPLQQKISSWWLVFIKKLPLILISLFVVVFGWLLGKWLTSWNLVYNKLGLDGMPALLVKRLTLLDHQ